MHDEMAKNASDLQPARLMIDAQLAATGILSRFELSTEFTRWKQRLDPRNAASTGMKPMESLALHGRLVAANYRPTGIKPVVAKRRKKCFTALPPRGAGILPLFALDSKSAI